VAEAAETLDNQAPPAKPLRAMNIRHLNRRFDQTRRQFFHAAGGLSAGTLVPRIPWAEKLLEDASPCNASLPPAFSGLKPLGERVRPIAPDEFRQRIERAQQLMAGAPLASSGSPSQAPTKIAAAALADQKIRTGRIGMKKPPASHFSIICVMPLRDLNMLPPTR